MLKGSSLIPGFIYDRYHCISAINSICIHLHAGILNYIPLDCDSMSRGNCVRHVPRGPPVILCTRHTTTPSTIPQGKHVISVFSSQWFIGIGALTQRLYCEKESCPQNYSYVNYRCHSNVSHSCLTINNAHKDQYYSLEVHFNEPNLMPYGSTVHFHVTFEGMYGYLYMSYFLIGHNYFCSE